MEGLKAAEARYLKEMDEEKEKMEKFKQEKQAKKQAVDDMEEDISKARRDVANLAKEIHNVGSQMSSTESKIEAKKNERQNILLQAKVCTQKEIPMYIDNISYSKDGLHCGALTARLAGRCSAAK